MSIYDTLNKEQKEAVLHTEGPLLLLAGAGSGKTRVLTHRIAYLIDELGVRPWNILAITFTNKAAGEMRERVDGLVGFGSDQIWVSTFHSACVRILRRHIDKLGYGNDFTIYDTDDQKTLMKDICKSLNIDTKVYKEKSLLGAISSAKDELVSVREYEQEAISDFGKAVYAKAYREYQERLQKNNALDFDDIIVKTVELFQNCPEILDSYQERFHYIMVDEYQDTNTAQFELVKLLAQKYRNLCVVGDDDQSIYKFRGANIRNILDFEKYFPETAVIRLEQNYRSTQMILDAANAVIQNNVRRKSKALWTRREEGELVHFRQFDNGYEEAEFIADDLCRRVKKGGRYQDCAVLYRTNAQARLLEERMIQESIPYNVVGGVNFYARKEIKDILAYLKTIDNGQDDVAVRRIINVPKRGIGQATMDKVADYARMRDLGLYEAMEYADDIAGLGRAAAKIRSFVDLIQNFRERAEELNLVDLLQEIIDGVEYEQHLQNEDDESAEDRLENVEELISKAASYQDTHDAVSLTEFLEEVALVADIDNVDSQDDRVLLMTLHSAKGLEFSNVYLAGMEDGLFPSNMTIGSDDPSDLEEERRLAYVGITRAKDNLTMTCARMRMLRGETQYNTVSRFVKEIPEELLDNAPPDFRSRLIREPEEYGGFERTNSYRGAAGFGREDGRRGTPGFERADIDSREGTAGFGREDSGGGSSGGDKMSHVSGFRPKAVLRPKTTAKADKPFIAKDISSLNQIAGISRGIPVQLSGELSYEVGDRVLHIRYGEGTVLDITKEPRDYKVTVEFDSAGRKIMYASFAKLKRI